MRKLKAQRAMPHLVALADRPDPSGRVEFEAVAAILEMGRRQQALGALHKLLKVGRDGVRAGSTKRLGDIGDPSSVPPLVAALKDNYADVRSGAAEALGKLKDPRAVPALCECLKDKYPRVRLEAHTALVKIVGRDLGRAPKRWLASVPHHRPPSASRPASSPARLD